MVVASYWRLYFQDPTLVNGQNAPVPYREYYLHLIGPALQWADVLLLKRGFRHLRATALWLGQLVLAYVAWAELVVAPLNDGPVGIVATGLPYPFLNDMAFPARLGFYAATGAAGLLVNSVSFSWARAAGAKALGDATSGVVIAARNIQIARIENPAASPRSGRMAAMYEQGTSHVQPRPRHYLRRAPRPRPRRGQSP